MDVYYNVYALYMDGVPVYIGCTKNVEKRVLAHKKDKVFNSYVVLYQNASKKDALYFEHACIVLMTTLKTPHYNFQKKFVKSKPYQL